MSPTEKGWEFKVILISSDFPTGLVLSRKGFWESDRRLDEPCSPVTFNVALLVSTLLVLIVLATLCQAQKAALLFGRLLLVMA